MSIDLSSGAVDAAVDTAAQAVIINEYQKADGHSLDGSHESGVCANCGATLVGHYCYACGQTSHLHRSLMHMLEESLHGIFHFDTKAWRTLPALALHPGQLTREYILGKRTSYVSPLALYLFMIFLMFFVFAYTIGDPDPKMFNKPQTKEEISKAITDAKNSLTKEAQEEAELVKKHQIPYEKRDEIDETRREIRAYEDQLNSLEGKVPDKAALNKELEQVNFKLAQLRQQAAEITLNQQTPKDEKQTMFTLDLEQQIRSRELDVSYLKKELKKLEIKDGKTVKKDADISFSLSSKDAKTGDEDFELATEQGLSKIPYIGKMLQHAEDNKALMLYKLKSKASSFAFLLMPISLPFLWMLFVFRRQYVMFDHAVFSLYSLSFMCLLMMFISILAKFNFPAIASILFTFVPPIHMYRQLRGAYQLGFFGALWRTCALLLIAFLSLLTYLLIVIALSL
jgi:hypothetical protein